MSDEYVCVAHHQVNCPDADCEAKYNEPWEKVRALELQDAAMRRALTDIMQFSSDERSRAVAKGILDAHGGPDPECMVKPECKCVWMDCGPIGMERSRKSPCPIHPFP